MSSESDVPDSLPSGDHGSTYDRLAAVQKAISRALVSIGAHADSVQVFVTWLDENCDTNTYHEGMGNIHARLNQARQWVRNDDAVSAHQCARQDDLD